MSNLQVGYPNRSFPSDHAISHFELLFDLKVAHFKISFESRRCCTVREHVARRCTVREKRACSCVQCKVEQFDQVEGLQRFWPDLPHHSRSVVLC